MPKKSTLKLKYPENEGESPTFRRYSMKIIMKKRNGTSN